MRNYPGIIFLSLILLKLMTTVFAIKGGTEVSDTKKYPFMVSLQWKTSRTHYCGGSIISDRFVLTAAQCLVHGFHEEILVVAGTAKSTNLQTYEISNWILHDQFEEIHTLDYDIGLIQIKGNFLSKNDLKPIAISTENFVKNDKVVMLGYGETSDTAITTSANLCELTAKVIDTKTCVFHRKTQLENRSFFCTQATNTSSTMVGDHGGPVIIEKNLNNYVLIGVISSTSKIDKGNYSIPIADRHIKVALFMPWIENAKKELIDEIEYKTYNQYQVD